MMSHLRAAVALALMATANALVIPTQPVLTRYAASKVLEAAEAKAKDEGSVGSPVRNALDDLAHADHSHRDAEHAEKDTDRTDDLLEDHVREA